MAMAAIPFPGRSPIPTRRLRSAGLATLVGLLRATFAAEPNPAPPIPDPIPIPVSVTVNEAPVLPAPGSTSGTWFYADRASGAQLLLAGHPGVPGSWQLTAHLPRGTSARLLFQPADQRPIAPGYRLRSPLPDGCVVRSDSNALSLGSSSTSSSAFSPVHLAAFTIHDRPATFAPRRRPLSREPVATSPDPAPAIADALVEWDWRLQDGLGTPREPRTFRHAIDRTSNRIEALVSRRRAAGSLDADDLATWERLRARPRPASEADDRSENLWRELHRFRRRLLLDQPEFRMTSLFFLKHVPSIMSHQLTQMYGYCSRPGGGLFELTKPGQDMGTRDWTPPGLPAGSFMTPEVSYDARRVWFAYCPVREAPVSWDHDERTRHLRYHVHELDLATGGVRALTSGDTDNFSPVQLPSGDLLHVSTRRGGYHRCGRGPCFVYTLARMAPDGSRPRSISFHETHEWDPSLLHDGRVLYTRWDYVDRNAVHYQQLWTTLPDGGATGIFFGNNTWNPTGIWEARAVPGSTRVMATAAPHHGLSAGSIVLLDTARGVDGPGPVTRLTPDVRFPESEAPLAHGPPASAADFDAPVTQYWRTPLVVDDELRKDAPEEERRWPGHCYKSPWPLSETAFVVSYSFDALRGEPGPNLPNMFGLYFADAFGNKELVYRDPAISSVWARPLARRTPPPEPATVTDPAGGDTGTFFLRSVGESWPYLPERTPITHLRILQVLLKTTPHADQPRVGAAFAAPGKQVLGTVPVEPDGSALFEVPARTPVLFQALDAEGRAVQTMRSLVYLQPGERRGCVGCHEDRHRASTATDADADADAAPAPALALALQRPPSRIRPGPDGSRPFSYPRLVQPVLDRHCVRCHDGKDPKRSVLTGEPDGVFTKSYHALSGRVSFSAWGRPDQNLEPLTAPLRFGTLGSPLRTYLEDGHGDVRLSAEERERLYTWMDANALFYGTFDPAEQRKQLAGEPIAGPAE